MAPNVMKEIITIIQLHHWTLHLVILAQNKKSKVKSSPPQNCRLPPWDLHRNAGKGSPFVLLRNINIFFSFYSSITVTLRLFPHLVVKIGNYIFKN